MRADTRADLLFYVYLQNPKILSYDNIIIFDSVTQHWG